MLTDLIRCWPIAELLIVVISGSVIGQHLINNQDCYDKYNLDSFRVISKRRNNFYLNILEAIYILCLKPVFYSSSMNLDGLVNYYC